MVATETERALNLALRARECARGAMTAYWEAFTGRWVPSPRLYRLAVAALKEFDEADRKYFEAWDANINAKYPRSLFNERA